MAEKFLDKVYQARDGAATRALYDDWAASYETEVAEHGYATPGRCAEALAAETSDLSKPVLDFGCGTGLSGLALKLAGFTTIDGLDLSEEMLAKAADKGVYRTLSRVEPGASLPHASGDYAAVAAIGVIGAGAAPIRTFDILMNGLAPGGLITLSFNDHALEDRENEGRLESWMSSGRARLLSKSYGQHLPGLGMGSNVYVIERL